MTQQGYLGKDLERKLLEAGATKIQRPLVSTRNTTCLEFTRVKLLNDDHIRVIDSEETKEQSLKKMQELPQEAFYTCYYSIPTLAWQSVQKQLQSRP